MVVKGLGDLSLVEASRDWCLYDRLNYGKNVGSGAEGLACLFSELRLKV
jgi:hypothetical protein